MARIRETLHVPIGAERAFDHVADFTTTARWDPGIRSATRLDHGPLGVGSRFRVQVGFGPPTVPLVYEITRYERPDRVVLTSRSLLHLGEDDVRFQPTEDGTVVDWRATFALRGPGRLFDPLLAAGFRRAGSAAVAGLDSSLHRLART